MTSQEINEDFSEMVNLCGRLEFEDALELLHKIATTAGLDNADCEGAELLGFAYHMGYVNEIVNYFYNLFVDGKMYPNEAKVIAGRFSQIGRFTHYALKSGKISSKYHDATKEEASVLQNLGFRIHSEYK